MTPVDTMRVGGTRIEEVDLPAVSAEDIRAWFAYDRIMTAEAPPLPFELSRARVKSIPDHVTLRLFVARDPDGAVAGDGRALIARTANNQHICEAHVSVRRDRRGRGVGKALLGLVVAAAEAEGRTLLVGWTSARVPAGDSFARRAGAEDAQHSHVNRLLLSELDRGLVRQWLADGPRRAPGYDLVTVDGPYPDDMLEAIADLRGVMSTAPRDALQLEAPMTTVEQLRDMNRRAFDIGGERWSIFARHTATGELVGFTEMGYHPAQPETIDQGGTAVRPAHRGHGLGRWLKAAMLERVLRERPGVEDIRTGNAASNEAMLRINRELGFRPWIAATAWQAPVERVREYLARAGAPWLAASQRAD